MRPFFATAVETTEELNYNDALDWFGLRFRPVDARLAARLARRAARATTAAG